MFTLGHTRFQVRIIYKSGADHTFWCHEFRAAGGEYTWMYCSDANKPLLLGIDEIAAIYQVGYRKGLLGLRK